MRIIGGKLRGLRLNPPNNLPVRPTTDLAKEALFNILNNQIEFEGLKVLDLFSGTGNISMEFASRDAEIVVSIDRSVQCIHYLNDMSRQHKLGQIKTFKADVFKYLEMETDKYDMIFADPPYDLNRIPDIPKLVFENDMLLPGGMLIVEHQSMQNLSQHPAFMEQRKYGHSSFSFFRNNVDQ
ncbi:16S rRNA (guanine(966)-N(2))-methyltransferase RsmD [Mucilaginibacter sp. PPCGB 2223]|uniref:16S rRNA (guanine(966)-N(2))-methyltransferase RsmD n=1 Tax=Mucilaginibacter sp. PPCGB 2223 TaxID=1886027 RepID=UPI00082531C3|nr:16S rRNA (guanine(966)-N(2))-methyltransferase RsmD [Mucilaginibacter sp. PPCGB 2223]OCX53268.1 16S rRNA (guanine(966)-N(2))-methyltransferase RsmD [Mucilaginibacter sp. PPCGB 2223]